METEESKLTNEINNLNNALYAMKRFKSSVQNKVSEDDAKTLYLWFISTMNNKFKVDTVSIIFENIDFNKDTDPLKESFEILYNYLEKMFKEMLLEKELLKEKVQQITKQVTEQVTKQVTDKITKYMLNKANKAEIEGWLKQALELYQSNLINLEVTKSLMEKKLGKGYDSLVNEYLDKLLN